jgi:hypothetical protein
MQTQVFIGHLGNTDYMAGGALGNMLAAFLTFFLFGTATGEPDVCNSCYQASRCQRSRNLFDWPQHVGCHWSMCPAIGFVALLLTQPDQHQ